MPTFYHVDRFTMPAQLEAFDFRRRAQTEAIGVLGLRGVGNERPGLVFGGSAFAAQGLDTYVGDQKPYDLDVVAEYEMFERLVADGHFYAVNQDGLVRHGMIRPSDQIPLPVDVFTCRDPRRLKLFTGGVPYEGVPNGAITEIDGIFAVQPGAAAANIAMVDHPRMRGLAGLVKAQVVAKHTGHSVVGENPDMLWHLSVGSAIGRLMRHEVEPTEEYPLWLDQLVAAEFDHPAFASIPKL